MAVARICSVVGCGKRQRTRGYCSAHYRRWWRHGDALAGNAAHGEAEKWLVAHKDHQGDECLKWPFLISETGYGLIRGRGRSGVTTASRRMCEIANGPPPFDFYQAAHSCGKGQEGCVNPKHLSWKTPSGNHADKIGHGTMLRGTAVKSAKLSEDDVRAIRALAGKESQRATGRRFGVGCGAVRKIQLRLDWAWLE